jgi:hypothetical protein
MTIYKYSCTITFILCTLSACTFNVQPTVPSLPLTYINQTLLGCEVTILMPVEFQNREYVSSFDAREIRIRIGEPASEAIETLVRARFAKVTKKTVTGDGTLEFLRMISSPEADGRIVLRPRITRLESSVRPFRYNLEFALAVDVAGLSAPATPSGTGVGTANIYSQSAIQKAANDALSGAVEELASTFPTECK